MSTTIQLNVCVTLIWMIKYVHCLGYHVPPGKFLQIICRQHMKKLKLVNHMETGGLQSFKVKTELTLISCRRMHFSNDKKRQSASNASNLVCAGLPQFICGILTT